jgi:AcrR family transcriptional regulator
MPERPAERTGAPDTSPRRAYRSRKREQASLETRQRIRAVAEALFLRDGYARTTTKAIARDAGVAEMTLFLAFENKAALLSEIIRTAVRGGDHETPMAASAEWQAMLEAPPHQILLRFAQLNGVIQATPTSSWPLVATTRTHMYALTFGRSPTRSRGIEVCLAISPSTTPRMRSTHSPTQPSTCCSPRSAAGGWSNTPNGSQPRSPPP